MKKIFLFVITIFALNFSTLKVFAGVVEHPIINNEYELVLIGEIENINNDDILINPINFIVNTKNFESSNLVLHNLPKFDGINEGDFILVALNKIGDIFEIGHVYPAQIVKQLDFEQWEIKSDEPIMSVVLSDFVNTDGKYSYTLRGGKILRNQGDSEIVIYDPDPPSYIQARTYPIEQINRNNIGWIIGTISVGVIAIAYIMIKNKSSNQTNI